MDQRCARPACGAESAASLTYDYDSRTVWLDPAGREGIGVWGLCARHADHLRVPVGWGLNDRRRPTHPTLVHEPVSTTGS